LKRAASGNFLLTRARISETIPSEDMLQAPTEMLEFISLPDRRRRADGTNKRSAPGGDWEKNLCETEQA
jgi:hypothetical protein